MADTTAKHTDTRRRWLSSALLTVFLALGLIVTSVAITISSVDISDNIFTTGQVKLNLNDEKPVISEDEFLFEPGMTVVKDFFLENEGAECWYKLYFDKVSGDLAKVLDVTIKDGDNILYSGKMADLTRDNVRFAGSLPARGAAGSRLDLTISFHFPEDAGNTSQSANLMFDLCADGTQVKNNPGKEF